jgi:HupE / UreJ protein
MKLAHSRAWQTIGALVLVLGQGSVSAHPVIVEQVVEMTVQWQGDLIVRLHVPAAVTGDASLALLLEGADTVALERQLPIVAADIARNLDVRQGDVSLPVSNAGARPGSDAASIDVEVQYAARAGDDDLSARLNAFSAKEGPVRTTARFRPAARSEQIVSISGPPTRVAFDPPLSSVVPDFAVRGLRALFDGGDHLLFLLCILLPSRRAKSIAALVGSAVFGQAVVIAASLVAPAAFGVWSSIAAMAAASAIVMAAVQNIAGARTQWILPVAVAFGALNGWTFGTVADASVQFAGAHRLTAMLVLGGALLAGELWLVAVAWAFRTWLDERGVPDRGLVLLGSVLVAHTAVHRLAERAQVVAQTGSFGGGRALLWLTLIWVGAMLLAAAANALSSAPERAHAS